MKAAPALLGLSALLLVLGSCESKDEAPTPSGVHIDFRTDSGYTYQNDTIDTLDTLHVGVRIDNGGNSLAHFYLNVSYNDSAAIWKDTLAIDSNPFLYDTHLVARDLAGKEQWSFVVQETNGDITFRKLTFIVQ